MQTGNTGSLTTVSCQRPAAPVSRLLRPCPFWTRAGWVGTMRELMRLPFRLGRQQLTKHHPHRWTILLVLLLGADGVLAAEPALPTHVVTRIDRDLVLSGKADDPLWQQAAVIMLTDADTGNSPQLTTTVRLLYNQQYLYVAYVCAADTLRATLTKRDGPLYTEDVVETFLAPSGSFRSFYEIEVSPLNTILDSYQLSYSRPDGSYRKLYFNPAYTCADLLTKVFVEGVPNQAHGAKSWTVEMAIPFTSIVGRDNIVPNPGDRWRANFCRIDFAAPDKPAFSSWSPLGGHDFNRSYRFGWIEFK